MRRKIRMFMFFRRYCGCSVRRSFRHALACGRKQKVIIVNEHGRTVVEL
jgi:hypothetical protein